MSKPRLAITLGDPAGIGFEITLRAVNSLEVQRVCSPIIFGDARFAGFFKKHNFIAASKIGKIKTGVASKKAGLAALGAIEKAVEYCLKGETLALVTAPVSKESLKLAGVKYPGHTELLAALTKSPEIAMMMVCGKILSVMVTRHIPLSEVSKKLKTKDIVETVTLAAGFDKALKIAVCALNPHAGDNGILGGEEKKIIAPACKILAAKGFNVSRPLPADSAWLKTKNGEFDLLCGMYHDQVMIPLKCIDAKKIVNVTAGLPFVRTSPGHGAAYDIAGKNIADESAMIAAIVFAAKNAKKGLR
ncbi:PdxA family dehydrogenase [Endomicrobium proavitum]|uniref:4-hydroxythreonine-4-phosphate dehydrogenase n=1 Tax=Endomicrobium proavitum TaxID=1408281 RepID=A0A0G3WIW1_9BACT|nr:4-hydroxythreonine-4-phosphate dehydrogenase PdxA [Endomicrobium proavitum]AKL98586.1 4-hydroxythreonine-4-phosphate dehydrogenase [Endomicrobium proavitum]